MPSPLVRLIAIELVFGREGRPVACAHIFDCPPTTLFLGLDLDLPLAGGDDIEFVAFLEAQFLDQSLGQANRKAVAPSGDLHRTLHDIQKFMYIVEYISVEFKAPAGRHLCSQVGRRFRSDGIQGEGLARSYFTAPNRLSNEFDCTTGAAPMIWVASPAPSDTDGFSAGRVAARRVSGLAGSAGLAAATAGFGASLDVWRPGTNRVTAAFSLDAAVGGVVVVAAGATDAVACGGGGVVAVASALPMPILRPRFEKKPDFSAGAAVATRALAAGALTATTGSSCGEGAAASRFGFGGLTCPGIVPGAFAIASICSVVPSAPSDRPVDPSGIFAAKILFMPPSIPVFMRATGVPRETSLLYSAWSRASFSRTALTISSGIT